jgi:hypothetical protein
MSPASHCDKVGCERLLDHYTLAAPSVELRHRVLCSTKKETRPPVSETLLRCALVALVATLVWASWQERQTAERMARLARVSRTGTVDEDVLNDTSNAGPQGGRFMTALLYPRVAMPIPPGHPSTRLQLWHSSLGPEGLGRGF